MLWYHFYNSVKTTGCNELESLEPLFISLLLEDLLAVRLPGSTKYGAVLLNTGRSACFTALLTLGKGKPVLRLFSRVVRNMLRIFIRVSWKGCGFRKQNFLYEFKRRE